MRATLISKYFKVEVKVNITNEAADVLKAMREEEAILWVQDDLSLVEQGYGTQFLKKSAAKKVNNLMRCYGDYINQIVF